VESAPGKGSTFWFTLTLPRAGAVAAPPARLAGLRLLLVDDLADSRHAITEALEHAGAAVESVESAAAARAPLADSPDAPRFHAVLIDDALPGTTGAALGEALAAEPRLREVPRVLLTSNPSLGDAQRFQHAGFSAYLVKPARVETLIGVLRRVIESPG